VREIPSENVLSLNATTPPVLVTVFAPAGVGNVGVGFDVLGHVFDAVGDRITVRRLETPTVFIKAIEGTDENLPLSPEKNTATAGLLRLIDDLELDFGFEVTIEKGIPVASGMGGSASSAVGAIVAANELLDRPLARTALFKYALVGETIASGAAHGDNLAPGLLGGMTLVTSSEPVRIVQIPVPPEIRCVLVHPHTRLETRLARQVLPASLPIKTVTEHSAHLAGFVAGCYRDDLDLIAASLVDLIAEPHRASLIPGFHAVKAAAMETGALACSISGAGPSIFAWCAGDEVAEQVCRAMKDAFAMAGLDSDGWVAHVNVEGARVVESL
jgi:homoserine kinase